MTYDLTDEVKSIGSLNFEGNIIPMEWLKYIRLPNNKPDLVSIFILSDIIYWYRPTTIRDELSGRIIGYRKKFKSDLLQKGYKDLEEMFGLSRDQLRDSFQRLEKLGLIKRVFRNINSQGSSLANVMFIQIFPNKIAETLEKKDIKINPNTYEEISERVLGNIRGGIRINPNTYTETTTKITTNNSLSASSMKFNKTLKQKIHNTLVVAKEEEREKEMLKIWNEIVEEKNDTNVKLTSKRSMLLDSRLKEFFKGDISLWKEFCQKIVSSKFLMGEVTKFKVQLDWALKEENLLKIIENSYGIGDRLVANSIAASETLEEEISDPIWKQAREGLKNQLGEGTFKSWISKLNFQIILDNTAHLTAPTKFIKEWILTNYSEDIKRNLNIHGANIQEIFIQAT
jgi:hypothetical protein